MSEDIEKSLKELISLAEKNFEPKFYVTKREKVEDIRKHIKEVMSIKNPELIPFVETPENVHQLLTLEDYKDMICNYHLKNEVGAARIIHDNPKYPQWRNFLFVPRDLTSEDESYAYTRKGWKKINYEWAKQVKIEKEYLTCSLITTDPNHFTMIMINDYKNDISKKKKK